jgi:plasmid maintenance system antidote protein VapI
VTEDAPGPAEKTKGARLREHLAARKMSAAHLARLLEAHPVTVWRWVAGKTDISAPYVEKIKAILGLALEGGMVLFVPFNLLF